MAADARLRRAYAAAARAGTSRAVLADYRWEWGRLRYRAPRQPHVVVERYDQMANELNRIAARRRDVRAERRPASAGRKAETQFAALWR